MYINCDKLRDDLIDYYGTAMFGGHPEAVFILEKIKKMNNEELVRFAQNNNIILDNYIIKTL